MFKEFDKPYIIAEIGANHNGDVELAKKMILRAKECGADCVKFQSWSSKTIFSKKNYDENKFLDDDYRNRKDIDLKGIVEKYQLNSDSLINLKNFCDEIQIEFNSTPFSKSEVDLLCETLNVPFIKIASMDVDNIPFLEYIARKKKTVVISTGLNGLEDIINAYNCLIENGSPEVILLHCVSIYPPNDFEVNLNNIDMFRDKFNCKVGYSDHTLGVVAPIMSIAKGVCIIEKHFTLDKEMSGWDHKISSDPNELKLICDAAKHGYKMLGSYDRVISESIERRNAFKRSIVAARNLLKGDIISESDIDYKRPGIGISPKFLKSILGKKLKRDIMYDEIIYFDDIGDCDL